MTVFSPSNTSRNGTGFQTWLENEARRREEEAARAADPVEQAVRYIRSRGRAIFRASVDGGPADRWRYAGQLLTADEVVAAADGIRRLAEQLRQARPEPPRPPDTPAPMSPAARPVIPPPAPPQEKIDMADIAETKRCKLRGTTPKAVQAHLKQLDEKLGRRQAAELLGIGFSTFINAMNGYAPIREGCLTALYGEAGSQLKPELVVALAPAQPAASAAGEQPEAEPHPAPFTPEAAVVEAIATVAPAIEVATPVAATVASPDQAAPLEAPFGGIQQLTVADLLAGARRRREQLAAELACIDAQIDAVHRLAHPLVIAGPAPQPAAS